MINNQSRKDWCKLPYALILDEKLTAPDAVIYAVLNDISFGGVATTTLPELVKKTGVPLASLKRCLKRLKDEGYIVSTKSDGRRLAIVVEQVVGNTSNANVHKPDIKYSSSSGAGTGISANFDGYEKILVDMLSKKLVGKSNDDIIKIYEELKADARIRVKDQSKLFPYLSTMIRNYEAKRDNMDGVNDALIDEYNKLWNDF